MPEDLFDQVKTCNEEYRLLAKQADLAFLEGDRARCIQFITMLYLLADRQLDPTSLSNSSGYRPLNSYDARFRRRR